MAVKTPKKAQYFVQEHEGLDYSKTKMENLCYFFSLLIYHSPRYGPWLIGVSY